MTPRPTPDAPGADGAGADGATDEGATADPAAPVSSSATPSAADSVGVRVGSGSGIGAVALVRVAGVPWEVWAGAGNEALFDWAAELDRESRGLASRAREVGERLGEEAVPDPRLPVAGRRAVLALRRTLHAGRAEAVGADAGRAALDSLAALGSSLGDSPGDSLGDSLWRDLAELESRAAALAAARDRFAREVIAERARAGELLLSLAHTYPALRDLVTAGSPRLLGDLERRVRTGEPWGGKRPRKGAGYLWRALGRAAAKTTPRGWIGQIAAVPVTDSGDGDGDGDSDSDGDGDGGQLLVLGAGLGAVAASATENVHRMWASRRDLDLRTAGPATPLALTPLHRTTPDQLHCHVVDPGSSTGDGSRLRRIGLRRTPVLDAVLGALAEGPRALGELESALAGGHGEQGRAVLRGFLGHLLRLGVLQVCGVPETRRTAWTPGTAAARAPARHPVPAGWFLDSYRTLDASVSAGAAARVADGLRLARRLAALRSADDGGTPTPSGWQRMDEAQEIGTEPRPVLEILAATQDGDRDGDGGKDKGGDGDGDKGGGGSGVLPRGRYAGWWPAPTSGSGYARLLAHLAARLGEEQIDLDEALLDALGAPPVPGPVESWPADCLLRPLPSGRDGASGPGPVAVLESASPAGVLDARFADVLDGNVHAYRSFLAAYERAAGARFAELLVPPLGEPAANAVRRPAVTAWSTGDPATGLYYATGSGPLPPVRHLPLHRITLRRAGRAGDRLIAEADGVRLLPVHHATRTPVPPYDRLLRLLTSAGHPASLHVVQLGGLAGAFPTAERVPRLTVGGQLVVSPAQWRLPRARLWRPADPEPVKAERLAALRRTAGLPRFGYVRTGPAGKPVPVDLAALPTLQALERLCDRGGGGAGGRGGGGDLWFEEALPVPSEKCGSAFLRDPAHGGAPVAAQILLRLPYDRTADVLAARAGAQDLPARLSSDGGRPGRTPHPEREEREGTHHAVVRNA